MAKTKKRFKKIVKWTFGKPSKGWIITAVIAGILLGELFHYYATPQYEKVPFIILSVSFYVFIVLAIDCFPKREVYYEER